jgi:hypothetical protein
MIRNAEERQLYITTMLSITVHAHRSFRQRPRAAITYILFVICGFKVIAILLIAAPAMYAKSAARYRHAA